MATGLKTFDDFAWSSLLKGRQTLVVDRDAPRARRTAAALEEAGAVVTLALSPAVGADRARDGAFSLAMIGLSGDETPSERLLESLARPGTALVFLADPPRHAALRARFPEPRIGDHSMSERDLVMFVIGTPDE